MAKKKDGKKKYNKGDTISIYINSDASDELIEWINAQKDIGPAIVDILDKVATNKYIHESVYYKSLANAMNLNPDRDSKE